MPLRNHLGGLAKKRLEKSYQPALISLKTEVYTVFIIIFSAAIEIGEGD